MSSLLSGEMFNTDLFRGEEMKLCQIYFQAEAAYACVSSLGECGVVQFNDVKLGINFFVVAENSLILTKFPPI